MISEDDISFEHARKVFDSYGLKYEQKLGGSMMWVQSKTGNIYGYYPTTHRWAPRHLRGKHYRAKSTEDFVERFVLKGDERKNAYNDFVEESFGVNVNESSMADLVFYIWDEFDGGATKTSVLTDIQNKIWDHIRSGHNGT